MVRNNSPAKPNIAVVETIDNLSVHCWCLHQVTGLCPRKSSDLASSCARILDPTLARTKCSTRRTTTQPVVVCSLVNAASLHSVINHAAVSQLYSKADCWTAVRTVFLFENGTTQCKCTCPRGSVTQREAAAECFDVCLGDLFRELHCCHTIIIIMRVALRWPPP